MNSEAARFGIGAPEYHVASFDESRIVGSARRHGGCGRWVLIRGWRGEIEHQRVRT
jgi:hypothetical protein